MKNPNIDPEVAETVEESIPAENPEAAAEVPAETQVSEENQTDEGEPGTEVAMLTVRDLRVKITEAYCQKYPRTWGYLAFLFPNENIAWFEDEDRESELDYQMITYTVENDVVTIPDENAMKLEIAERFMKQMTTTTETPEHVIAERTNQTDADKTDNAAFMRVLLGR